ncbi:MAG: SH3 domain-containing protein [Emcibacter sp.]|nr:SH3 domain-containing protein [Emcibacter sp.]
MAIWRIIFVTFSFLIMGLAYFPAVAKEKTTVGKSGYLVPRYVSLAKNTVNVRTGPNGKYPIIWVFKKSGLPVKVIAEYKNWRKIVDSEGASGWIWGPLLSSKRTALIIAEQQALLKGPDSDQPTAVIAEAGVIGKIHRCEKGWCELDVNGFKGWLEQPDFWGTLEGEILD